MIVSQTENVGLETTHQQPHIVTAVGEDEDYLKWKPAREELLILACLAIVSLVVALDATILVPVLPVSLYDSTQSWFRVLSDGIWTVPDNRVRPAR